ncbi:MAG: hypothetical protein ACYDCO_14120 [Armatimonadota bacterium]
MRVLTVLLVAVGLLLPVLPSVAAEPNPPVKIRQFLDQRNVVIESRQIELGTVTDKYNTEVTFYALTCSSPSAKPNTVQGVEIVLLYPKAADAGEDADPTSVSVYLDYDELSVFKDNIGTLIDTADDWEDPKSLSTVTLKSRDDFTMRISKYPGATACVVGISGYDGENFVFAFFETPQHLLAIKGYLEKALKVLPPTNTKT